MHLLRATVVAMTLGVIAVAPTWGQVTGSGNLGQATFWTGTTTVSGDAALFWKIADKRLGIRTNGNPKAALQALWDTSSEFFDEGIQLGQGMDPPRLCHRRRQAGKRDHRRMRSPSAW